MGQMVCLFVPRMFVYGGEECNTLIHSLSFACVCGGERGGCGG